MDSCLQIYTPFISSRTIWAKCNKLIVVGAVMCWCLQLFSQKNTSGRVLYDRDVLTGAEQTQVYLPLLEGKAVAVVANQTSLIDNTHLVDSLISIGVNVVKIFSPEHGFRGDADAGEEIKNGLDSKTGLPVVSLYGNNKKPKTADLKGVDVVVFDIQDVGARFYTYISTMSYVMEACAENVKEFLVLDRPNPNGFYVDGPVLEKKYKSFVGLHPVPVVHGMTVAEYAIMINEEKWLKNGVRCALEYVKCENYTHSDYYQLPVKPSPNLPNMTAIYLYPSLCFFEGTVVSVGRGTEKPFQIYGHPKFQKLDFTFIPISIEGAKNPKLKGEICNGFDFAEIADSILKTNKLHFEWLTNAYAAYPTKEEFFLENGFINLLAGTNSLKDKIIEGVSAEEIRKGWQIELAQFKNIRKKYLLYQDFE